MFVPNPRNLHRIRGLHAAGRDTLFPKRPAGHITPAITVVVPNSSIFILNAEKRKRVVVRVLSCHAP